MILRLHNAVSTAEATLYPITGKTIMNGEHVEEESGRGLL
jgi:hypothetical protein